MAWNWKVLIPGYGGIQQWKQIIANIKNNGYQAGDILKGYFGFDDSAHDGESNSVADYAQQQLNNHGLNADGSIDINSANPVSSADNVINYDPNKTAQENMLGYAQANNSASAYAQYLANQHEMEMSNTAISRAIADAEANGISKYQLFQSGNMAASTPSSGSSMYQSYENAMNRRESYNEKELAAITAIVLGTINAAAKMIG